MGFDSRFFTEAENELSRIRSKNRARTERRIREITTAYPETGKMISEMSETVSKLLSYIAEKSGGFRDKLLQLENENLRLQEALRRSLISHGYPPDYLDPIYDCRICSDTGIVSGKRCACFMEKVRKAAYNELNSRSPLRLCSFDDFSLGYYDDKEIVMAGSTARKIMELNLNTCRNYAENFHLPYGGLLMIGKTGLGKTHLSLSIASAVIDKGYSAVYVSAPDVFRTIKNEHFSRENSQHDTIDMLIHSDLLVLDDLGAETELDAKINTSVLYNIINDRQNASLPTIINSNLDLCGLEERYGERIVSRISSMDTLLFAGKDIRSIKAAQ
ncbi:MAG: ATP-binding protein [Ruminiclostridium sp.]|nr:ATP-binding protein [Ruminiclostridium sp.]